MADTRSKDDILRENAGLRKRIAELESASFPPCPDTGFLPENAPMNRHMLESLPVGVIVVNDGGFFSNGAVRAITGYDPDEISTEKDWFEKVLIIDPDRMREMACEDNTQANPGPRVVSIRRKDGAIRRVEFSRNTTADLSIYILRDVTDSTALEKAVSLNARRLDALDRLHGMHALSIDEICRFSIEEGIALTGSEIGYLAFLNEDETELSLYAWSDEAMKHCAVQKPNLVYRTADTGLWGEAIRQRRPVVTNDYSAPNPLKKGIPEGHVPIHRHMNVPFFEGTHIVAVAGVANKAEPYDDADAVQLTLLMDGMWAHVRRLRAVAALRESEENYKCLFESAGDGILIMDGRRIVDCNRAAEEIYGLSREELLGSDVVDLSPPIQPDGADSAKAADERIGRALLEEAVSFEWVHARRDGNLFYTEISLAALKLISGPRLLAFVRDVSKRKAAEEALLRSEHELESIVRNTPDIIYRLNTEGVITFINDAVMQYGYDPEKIVGTNIFEYVHQGDIDRIKTHLIERRTGDRSTKNFEVRLFPVSRVARHFETKTVPFVDTPVFLLQAEGLYASERPTRKSWLGTQGVARDITDRKRAEEALRESEERFRSMIQSSSDMIMIIEKNGLISYESPSVSRIMGFPEGYFVGLVPLELVYPEDKDLVAREMEEVFRKVNSGDPTEFRLKRADGAWMWLEALATNLFDNPVVRGIVLTVRNITERKATEDALRESRLMLRSILDTIPARVFWKDRDLRFLGCNNAFAQDAGLESPEKMIGKTDCDMIWKNQADMYRADDRQVMESGIPKLDYEEVQSALDGDVHWLKTSKIPLRDADGNVTGILGTYEEITARKAAEEALRENEEKLRQLFENIREIIWLRDKETGGLFYINPAAETVTGYSSREITANIPLFSDSIHAGDRDRYKEAFRLLYEYDTPLEEELRFTRRDGESVLLLVREYPVRNATGEVTRYVGVAEDISARKRVEAALQHSEERFSKAFRSSPVAISITRLDDGTLLDINEALEDFLGYTREEMVGHTTPEMGIWADPGFRETLVEALSSDGSMHDRECLFRTKNGDIVTARYSAETIEIGGDQCILSVLVDITAWKAAEEALIRSEERFSKAFQSSPVPFAITRLSDGVITDGNEALEVYLGYSREEMVGHTTSELGLWTDKGFRRKLLGMIAADGSVSDQEWPIRTKKGDIVTARYSAEKIEIGGEQCILSVFVDITARKAAEEALRENEEKFRQLVENIREIVWLRDKKTGSLVYVSPSYENITGYPAKDALADIETFFNAIDPEDREHYLALSNRMHHDDAPMDVEFRFVRSDGNRIWLWSRAYPIRDESGTVVRFAGVSEDITARKESEAVIRQSEQLLSTYFDLPLVGRVILSGRGKMIRVNDRFCEIVGYDRADIGALKWTDITPYEDMTKLREFFKRVRRGMTDGLDRETTVIRKDGKPVTIFLSLRAVRKAGGTINYFVIDVQDITDRKRLEAQFAQSQKMESVGRLAGGVAHDFNNILTVINMTAEIGLMSIEPGEPYHLEFDQIRKSGERAADLTRKLLAFSRKQIMAPLVININDVLLDMDKMFRRLIGEDIELVTIPTEGIPNVRIDPGQMEQVLTNLVVNARDAMQSGGKITIETQATVIDGDYTEAHIGAAPGEYVMVSVSDTGTGMSEEVRSHLFEPFFTTKEHGKGTGLGLSTCYGIVKQNGGHIWVYSEPGKGSSFKIYLPAVRESSAHIQKPLQESIHLGGGETLLLVEDDPAIRRVTERILATSGYNVIAASNGEDALAVAANHQDEIRLLLTDVVMPLMSGRELADRFSARMPDLKVLFMSGYTDDSIVHHGVLDEGVSFIQKPFSAAALLKKVRDVMDGV